jgi:S-adenosylmethionine:tRNA ribosyltransferase-isomerase
MARHAEECYPGSRAVHTADFEYRLPDELIAQHPSPTRDGARLLHVEPRGSVHHRWFRELPSLLRRGDVVVFNDSRVIPARLLGHKVTTGGKAELLLVRPVTDAETGEALAARADGTTWICLGQASKGLKPGARLTFEGGLEALVRSDEGEGEYRVCFTSPLPTLEAALERAGRLPLPPYITRAPELGDDERYQTIFARRKGSVAAPTAGLHFTRPVLDELEARGVERRFVTLEVGPGTFLPVREGDLSKHRMHLERCEVPEDTAVALRAAKREGRRIIAVGTTVVRTLESMADEREVVRTGHHGTSLFITPGFRFQVVDALLTNFHLPRSTLLMLVCAFLGTARTLEAYELAVRERYRFFSYGDSMFIGEGG